MYSCNDEINQWAHNKGEIIEIASRQQLRTLPLNYQIPAFRALSNEKKAELWREKLNIIRAKNYWTEEEKNHINKLNQLICPEVYNKEKSKNIKDRLHNWEQYAYDKMNWDSTFVFFNFCTFSTEKEFLRANMEFNPKAYSWLGKNHGLKNTREQNPPPPKPDCICRSNWYCLQGYCDKKDTCKETWDGCGIIGSSSCQGLCSNGYAAKV